MNNWFISNRQAYNLDKSVNTYDTEGLRNIEKDVLDKYFFSPGRVLDLGCGTGRTSIELEKMGFVVDAIDYSEAMIAKAISKNVGSAVVFKVMDAERLIYDDGTFDYAFFSFNGIDYLYPEEKRLRSLREIHRVLKIGGIFVFSSHNSHFIPNNIGRLINFLRSALRGKIVPYRFDFQSFGTLLTRFISPKDQYTQLKDCGFTPLNIMSKYSNDRRIIDRKDPYPTYICKK